MKKFVALPMKKKRAGTNGKMMIPTFFELYTVLKKLEHFSSILYSLYIILLQVVNISKSQSVKYENTGLRFFKNTMYTHNPFNKVIKF